MQNSFPKFTSPEEEIAFLREEIKKRENELEHAGEAAPHYERAVEEKISEYRALPAQEILAPEHAMPQEEIGAIVLNLAPETHDRKMEELLGILVDRGVMNALSVVEEMQNPHIEDDFHRMLVQYIKQTEGSDTKSRGTEVLSQGLTMTLFEVSLPSGAEREEQKKTIEDLLGAMEQFYSGMMSIDPTVSKRSAQNYFSIEIALPHIGDEITMYVAVPDSKKGLFEKQILALFPGAKILEAPNDYNVFNAEGVSLGAYAGSSRNPIFPLKTYKEFHEDPLNVVLNVFSKLEKAGEGAAVQFLISPVGDTFTTRYKHSLEKLKRGESLKEVLNDDGEVVQILKGVFKEGAGILGSVFSSSPVDPKEAAAKEKEAREKKKQREKERNQDAIEKIEEKIASPIFDTNIRVIASAANRARAEEILGELESAFHQFEDGRGNGIAFHKLSSRKVEHLFHDFSFRLFSVDESFPLNIQELVTVCHFPTEKTAQPQLKEVQATQAPAPLDLPEEGIILGENVFRAVRKDIRFGKEDRVRHFYVIGQTGTGKTVLLKNMIIQDIQNGDGVCYIDPHGTDIEDILANIPRERVNDVIYFDPSHMARPMGLNMLEFDPRFPEQKTFVVNELLSIFNKLFDMKVAGGPAFEQYFRNASLLVMEHPESGNTLLEIGRVMGDKRFREMKLLYCKNPIIKQFWTNAEKTTGEQSLANFVPYITNKFDVFITNDIMRPIVAQEHSAFNFREIMDERKILLVNLAKGRLGDINSHLLGLVLVGKILMAALSRVDVLGKGEPPPDFYLYIDEFQNVTTDSISTILSEARKYRLSLNMAHQFIGQLEEKIRDSVFGNVGSMAVFRVGAEDAEFFEKQFQPTFSAADIIKIANWNAYTKLLMRGLPSKPFSIATLAPQKGHPELADHIKELSHLRYGRDRAEIEAEIMAKYNATASASAPASTTSAYTPQNTAP